MATLSASGVCLWAFFLLLCTSGLALSQFVTVPPNVEVNETDEVTFGCSYSGRVISWEFEGSIIASDDSRFSISHSDDHSQSNVTITAADHNIHSGSYYCLATDSGSNDSERSNFTVTVNYLDNPAFFSVLIQPDECTPSTVYIGSTVTLTCEAPDGFPVPSIAWFNNGAEIRQEDNENLDFSMMKRVARISSVSSSDGGEYYCEVTNVIDRRRSVSAVLRVTVTSLYLQVPRIYLPGLDPDSSDDDVIAQGANDGTVHATLGESFSLVCRIESPFPVVDPSLVGWTRNGAGLVSGQSGYVLHIGPCDFSLNIESFQESHVGTYRCVYRGNSRSSQSVVVDIAPIETTPGPDEPTSSPTREAVTVHVTGSSNNTSITTSMVPTTVSPTTELSDSSPANNNYTRIITISVSVAIFVVGAILGIVVLSLLAVFFVGAHRARQHSVMEVVGVVADDGGETEMKKCETYDQMLLEKEDK